jgi:acyl-homoserine lactone synthase
MFRLRAKFFKDTLGWSALTVSDGLEKDDYDDDRAIYLLALDADGDVVASVRLRPTRDKSLLLDHFPHLLDCAPESVKQPNVWESCRYFASGKARGPQGALRREELRLAMVEAARAWGVDRIVAITDTMFLPSLIQASWTTKLLGLPAVYDEGECIALEISCSEDAYVRMQERLAVHHPVLLDLPSDLFPDDLPHHIEQVITYKIPPSEASTLMGLMKDFSEQDLRVLARVVHNLAEAEQTSSGSAQRLVAEIVQDVGVPHRLRHPSTAREAWR